MKGNRMQSLHFGKREKGRYVEESDWSSCSINCPIKIVYRSWQSKAEKTWGWLKCCNLIGSPAKRRYFQIRKTRVTSLCFQLGNTLFRPGLFSFSYVNCSLFIRSVLLLIFNLCIGTELFRVEFAERNWINSIGQQKGDHRLHAVDPLPRLFCSYFHRKSESFNAVDTAYL